MKRKPLTKPSNIRNLLNQNAVVPAAPLLGGGGGAAAAPAPRGQVATDPNANGGWARKMAARNNYLRGRMQQAVWNNRFAHANAVQRANQRRQSIQNAHMAGRNNVIANHVAGNNSVLAAHNAPGAISPAMSGGIFNVASDRSKSPFSARSQANQATLARARQEEMPVIGQPTHWKRQILPAPLQQKTDKRASQPGGQQAMSQGTSMKPTPSPSYSGSSDNPMFNKTMEPVREAPYNPFAIAGAELARRKAGATGIAEPEPVMSEYSGSSDMIPRSPASPAMPVSGPISPLRRSPLTTPTPVSAEDAAVNEITGNTGNLIAAYNERYPRSTPAQTLSISAVLAPEQDARISAERDETERVLDNHLAVRNRINAIPTTVSNEQFAAQGGSLDQYNQAVADGKAREAARQMGGVSQNILRSTQQGQADAAGIIQNAMKPRYDSGPTFSPFESERNDRFAALAAADEARAARQAEFDKEYAAKQAAFRERRDATFNPDSGRLDVNDVDNDGKVDEPVADAYGGMGIKNHSQLQVATGKYQNYRKKFRDAGGQGQFRMMNFKEFLKWDKEQQAKLPVFVPGGGAGTVGGAPDSGTDAHAQLTQQARAGFQNALRSSTAERRQRTGDARRALAMNAAMNQQQAMRDQYMNQMLLRNPMAASQLLQSANSGMASMHNSNNVLRGVQDTNTANMFASDNELQGTRYTADQNLAGVQATNQNRLDIADKEIEQKNAAIERESRDRNFGLAIENYQDPMDAGRAAAAAAMKEAREYTNDPDQLKSVAEQAGQNAARQTAQRNNMLRSYMGDNAGFMPEAQDPSGFALDSGMIPSYEQPIDSIELEQQGTGGRPAANQYTGAFRHLYRMGIEEPTMEQVHRVLQQNGYIPNAESDREFAEAAARTKSGGWSWLKPWEWGSDYAEGSDDAYEVLHGEPIHGRPAFSEQPPSKPRKRNALRGNYNLQRQTF